MAPRQFTLGDHVRLALDSSLADNDPQDVYTISRMLPIQADVWQYRVKRIYREAFGERPSDTLRRPYR